MDKQIQWFPGHMSKATREIQENADKVDILIELLDARAPLASRNPMLDKINKKRVVVLTKVDLADKTITKEWEKYFHDEGCAVITMNLKNKIDVKSIINAANEVMKDKIERDRKRGIRDRAIRAMVVGIPNVGKSTFINKMSGRKATSVANKPGHTKSLQWVKNDNLELLDTPGILWPKFEDQNIGLCLALIGSIKEDILNKEVLSDSLLKFMVNNYKEELTSRYNIDVCKSDLFEEIAISRGLLQLKGLYDIDKARDLLLKEFKDGVLGKMSLQRPGELWLI